MSQIFTMLTPMQRRQRAHKDLALAVIVQAIRDLDAPKPIRRDAEDFFSTDAVSEWCGVAGLDPAFVQEIVKKYREFGRPSRRVRGVH
jgi:hypothetical protein